MNKIHKIGVLTSGGDAPGMNAAIRAVVRTAIHEGVQCAGIYRGYEGMIEGDIIPLSTRSVNHIINRGGTILKSARSKEFRKKEGRELAAKQLQRRGIDALVVIGGDGSFTGAKIFEEETGIPTIGLPGTIDNDLYGTDYTIGYDTATNIAMECIDKIRDTAQSHNRLFFVEVMGRDSGFIALRTGLAAGCLAIMLPEEQQSVDELVATLERASRNGKTSSIVIVAEGDESGGALKLAEMVKQKHDKYETKVTILGHLQRGGSPTCLDRVLASYLGYNAVKLLLSGTSNAMVGLINDKVKTTAFGEAIGQRTPLNKELLEVAHVLSL